MSSPSLSPELLTECHRVMGSNDIAGATTILQQHPDLLRQARQLAGPCWKSPLSAARSVEMADLLLKHGASLKELEEWWAPGFDLDDFNPAVAEHLIHQGAKLTVHAAAALGMTDQLAALLDRQPNLIHTKGGDGCHPLHFSRNLDTARLLLDRGADVNARDDDHNSTPAQWLIRRAPDVTRFLLERGATPDIFMAAGLGDLQLAERLVREQPECATYRIGHNNGPFPGIGSQGRGGTIYQWTLGFNQSPHEIAFKRGHQSVFDVLMKHTPPKAQFLVACTLPNRPLAESLASQHPGLVSELDADDRSLLAKFCWETNIDIEAVRLMLDLGFPVDASERNHGYSPLHNAAWCGHLKLVELLIERGHPVNTPDPGYKSTPLGWAIHSRLEAKRHPEGAFPEVIEALLRHGATFDSTNYPTGHGPIDAILAKHLNT